MQALESRVQLAQKRKRHRGIRSAYPRNGQAQSARRESSTGRPYPHAQSSSSGTQQDHIKKCQIALNLQPVSIPTRSNSSP